MAGFPALLTRLGLGQTFRNRGRIRNPNEEADANVFNLAFWQLAGMNGMVSKAMFVGSISGTTLTTRRKWLAWDPNAELPASVLVLTRTGLGTYTYAFDASSYADHDGNLISLALDVGVGAAYLSASTDRWTVQVVPSTDGYTGTIYTRNSAEALADPTVFAVWLHG